MTAPLDAGLQLERTALAWRRTAMSLVIGGVAGARLLATTFGVAAIALAALGVGSGLVLFHASNRRIHRTELSLGQRGNLSGGPGAATLALVTATCLLAGVSALALLAERALT